MSDQRPLSGGAPVGPDGGTAVGTGGSSPARPDDVAGAPPGGDDALAEAVLGEGDPAEVATADAAAVDGASAPGDAGARSDEADGVPTSGDAGARPDEARDLTALAEELGACAAGVPGVAQVRPRPGFAALAQQVVEGVRRWRDLRTVVGGGAPAAPGASAPGASAPGASASVVGLAVSDAEVRITLDVAVADGHAGPAVARAVVAELLAHPALADLPEAWVDLRIVSIG